MGEKKILEALMLVTAGLGAICMVPLYGRYKYYCGKVDAHKTDKIVIDAQQAFIKELLKKGEGSQ